MKLLQPSYGFVSYKPMRTGGNIICYMPRLDNIINALATHTRMRSKLSIPTGGILNSII